MLAMKLKKYYTRFYFIFVFLLYYLSADVLNSSQLSISDFILDYNLHLVTTAEVAVVEISWKTTSDTRNFRIARKLKTEKNFETYLAYIEDNSINKWRDTIEIGKEYEYSLEQVKENNSAFAYFASGVDIPLKDDRLALLLLIDTTFRESLSYEISRLVEDITGDGWRVHIVYVPRAENFDKEKVNTVAKIIKEKLKADSNIKSLFLLGRVPVPYSGNYATDGHIPEHAGAWPCDGYYQSLNVSEDKQAFWRDSQVDSRVAVDERNWNVPQDGKFDNDLFPYKLDISCGRVDMYNLPAFNQTEEELLRQYLNQNHNYRNKIVSYENRGVVNDFFKLYSKYEAFAANGWLMFGGVLGVNKVDTFSIREILRQKNYLFAYGCGPGKYTSCYDIISTEELAQNGGLGVAFSFLFGSWFGDWDNENNLMRAMLASNPPALTCAWAARPYWFIHNLNIDEPIGYSSLLTQNNESFGTYVSNSLRGHRGIHIALLGDPTLRIYPLAPVKNLTADFYIQEESEKAEVKLTWEKSDTKVLGYNVYRAQNMEDKFVKLNNLPIENCEFVDENILLDSAIYQVRAVSKEYNFSASYFTQSTGKFVKVKTVPSANKSKVLSAYVFPNPAKDYFSIIVHGIANKPITIRLFSLLGEDYGKIYEETMLSQDLIIKFNVNSLFPYKNLNLASGLYYMKLSQDGEEINSMFIIQQ